MMGVVDELKAWMPVTAACTLAGVSRATRYRRQRPAPGPRPTPTVRVSPSALGGVERAEVLAVLDDDRFVDKAPEQVWAILLDEGSYLCSVSTMYRILRAHKQVRERRTQAVHPPRTIPHLVASKPSEVFSWDITKLKGPVRGVYYDAYVVMDIFSRKIIHHVVHTTENGDLAKDFLHAAVTANRGVSPRYLHSDNGTSMTSKTVAGLLADLDIKRSLSRPHVSNDNPYSEALFKTVKYCPAFPDRFGSIHDARRFMTIFVDYYNNHHRHSGIGLHTPASVHDGTWKTIQTQRQQILDAAYQAHPERFHHGPPKAPTIPTKAWINRPPATIQTSNTQHTPQAA